MISETDPLSEVTSYAYDAAGRLTEQTDRRGLVTEFHYDDLNRMTSEVWKDGSSTVRTLSFSYDAAGNLLSASDPTASYDFVYDALHRTTQTEIDFGSGVNPFRLTNQFDAASRRTSLELEVDSGSGWGDDLLNSYTYDDLGRLTQVTQAAQVGGATVQDKRVDFAYTVGGSFDSITRYKALSGGSANEVARSEYVRDDLGRVTSLEHLHETTSIADYDFRYDAYSRITQIAATSLVGLAGTTDFTYDTTGQLTAADHTHISDEDYSYDENGNRTNTGYTTAAGNRMTSDGTFDYTYDDNGNRLTKVRISTAPADDKTVEYEWDHRNRLIGITTKNNTGVVTKEVDYSYDVFDRRASKSIDADGAGPGAADVTRFVYDGGEILAVTDASGDVTHRMLHGPAVDQILAIEEDATGEVLWGLADHLGSIRDIVDNDGNVENHLVYDAFGNVVSETAASVDFLYGFTGRERDEESGLNYHRARYYDTSTGRWLSNDPIGFAAGDTNIQRYVGNDPVNYTDPSGLVRDPAEDQSEHTIDDVDSVGMWEGHAGKEPSGKEKDDDIPWFNRPFVYIADKLFGHFGDALSNDFEGNANRLDNLEFVGEGSLTTGGGFHVSEGTTAAMEETAGAYYEFLAGGGVHIRPGSGITPRGIPTGGVAPKKVPSPSMKSSPFGPKIEDAIPKGGVPKNWSKVDIADAIDDYELSIASRYAEQRAFDAAGIGSATERLAHARRITQEESFLASLRKALENRK